MSAPIAAPDDTSLWDDVDGDLEGEPFNTWPTREEVEKHAWIHEQTMEYLRRQRETR